MARQHRFVGRSVGGGPLIVCMIAFSDLWYSLSFFPANMAITAILFIWMACKAGELKHLWLSMNRPPTLSGVVSICSNIHNLCLATLFPTILVHSAMATQVYCIDKKWKLFCEGSVKLVYLLPLPEVEVRLEEHPLST